jgi:carbamoyltransferase
MTSRMPILGVNAYHGDSSAALLTDGVLQAAVEEERFNRIKHWAGFPSLAIDECLRHTDPEGIEHIAISRNPGAHLARKVARALRHPGSWGRVAGRARNILRVRDLRSDFLAAGVTAAQRARLHFVEHHRAHLASAFFASPFSEAAVVSVDGFGDFSSVMWGTGRGASMDIKGSVCFPHSLGLFYTAFTQFLGFPKYGDEYKLMGLAAYGEPIYAQKVRDVVRTRGVQVQLNLDYFTHHTRGVDMTWEGGEPALGTVFSNKMIEVFGEPRMPRTEVLPKTADMAASVQLVLEENYFALLTEIYNRTKMKAVCLAGGVALNCAANGKLFENTPFRDVYVQPAAHDAGTSIGAALYVQHQVLGRPRSYEMKHVYYGSDYTDAEIARELDGSGVVYHRLDQKELVDRTAREIANGKIVGWFQGRSEFGPRALGNRSILADPRRKDMMDTLNRRIKFREPFRPFCPSILAEATDDYFEINYPSPFMVQAYRIRSSQRANIPAVTHADGTGRLQTVERDANPLYWSLLDRFRQLTGVPILINTSFNENEPIVNTPKQALDCFLRTQMDVLVMGSYLLAKTENAQREAHATSEAAASEGPLQNR